MNTNQPESVDESDQPSDNSLGILYSVLTARRTTFDTLMWQVPALGLTAQAFLLTIALTHGNSEAARILASALALLIALLCMQTMSKWRAGEVVDSRLIAKLETRLHLDSVFGIAPHAKLKERAPFAARPLRCWRTWRSYALWMGALGLFAAASVASIVLAICHPTYL